MSNSRSFAIQPKLFGMVLREADLVSIPQIQLALPRIMGLKPRAEARNKYIVLIQNLHIARVLGDVQYS